MRAFIVALALILTGCSQAKKPLYESPPITPENEQAVHTFKLQMESLDPDRLFFLDAKPYGSHSVTVITSKAFEGKPAEWRLDAIKRLWKGWLILHPSPAPDSVYCDMESEAPDKTSSLMAIKSASEVVCVDDHETQDLLCDDPEKGVYHFGR